MKSGLCPLPHTGSAVVGALVVCDQHRVEVDRALGMMGSAYADLESMLVPVSTGGVLVRASREPGINLDHRVVEARAAMRNLLVTWVRVAVDTGGWRQRPRDDVGMMANWIRMRLDWMLRQDFAAAFAGEALGAAGVARRLMRGHAVRMVEVGACIVPGCDGRLSAVFQSTEGMSNGAAVVCSVVADDGSSHEWAPGTWAMLGRDLRQ